VTLICVVSCLYLGDRFKKRILFGIVFLVIGIFGTLLIWLLPSQYKVGRLIGYYM
jgi:MFS transporter, ACS family, allantoate permease